MRTTTLTTLIATLGVLGITSVSSAAVLTQTVNFPNTQLNVNNDTETFNQFDPTLGTLESVTITYNLAWSGVGGTELIQGNAADVNLQLNFNIALNVANGTFEASGIQTGSQTQFLEEFDGVMDLDGPSGFNFALSNTQTDTAVLTDAGDLANFIGTGTQTVVLDGVFSSIGYYEGSGPHFLVLSTDGDVEASVDIVYTYAESSVIPSPAAVWAGLSLVGMAVLRRRQRNVQTQK